MINEFINHLKLKRRIKRDLMRHFEGKLLSLSSYISFVFLPEVLLLSEKSASGGLKS